MKFHRHSGGNRLGLLYDNHCQDYPNVAVLIDVNHVMRLISFEGYAETERGTPDIIHQEPILHWIHDLPNQGCISNDGEIIGIGNDCGNDHPLMLIIEHEHYSVDI